MIACITGGTGFIGRRLAIRHLARGDEVRLISRREPDIDFARFPVKWWQADLSENTELLQFMDGADVLYHCAAEVRNTSRMHTTNIEATARLVTHAEGRITRWVQLSSVGVYGNRREGLISEDSELSPVGIYETTKLESDVLVSAAAQAGAFEHVILRPSNIYGISMRSQSLFRLISMIDRGLFFFIGKRGASANYIHVENVVDALELCGTHPAAEGKAYILSDYQPLETFIEYIAEALNRPSPRLRLPEYPVRLLANVSNQVFKTSINESSIDALTNKAEYSSSKIELELGYKHGISMQAGLHELVEFWKEKVKENNDKQNW